MALFRSMELPHELWNRLFFLRTWVYFFAVMTYLFLGNLWFTMLVVEGVEAMHSLLVYVRLTRLPPKAATDRRFYYWVDVGVSILMAVVASLSIVLVEYVFNSVVFIGEDRTAFFIVFFLLLFGARCLLLFVKDQLFSGLSFFAIIFLLFFLAVIGTNEIFFNDARTVTISVVYIAYTFMTAIVWGKWIHYYGYVVHAIGLVIFLAIFWHKHSSIPFARYVNWRHSF